jgi:hypothetical protein
MPFTLTTQPGFSDIPDSVLQAEKAALGLLLARIDGNASFGAVRPEIFYGLYKDGEEVILPVSPVDKYQYSRSELTYVWGIYSTVRADSGWISGPGPLWYCAWLVGQGDGKVSCIEWYRNSEGDLNSNSGSSSDGVLAVYTIAQRAKTSIILSEIPNFADVDDAEFAVDKPLKTTPLQQLSRNAKYAALAGEVFYLGEYSNGQTVTLPKSLADGYEYSIGECKFMTSWRWTTAGGAFTQPNGSLGQLHRISASVNPATGVVTTEVVYYNSGYFTTTHGRIAVFAFCNRTAATVTQVNVPCRTRPWDVSSTLNTSFPFGRGDGTSPVRVPLRVNIGDSVSITYLSGTVRISDARPFVDGDGQVADPSGTSLSGGKRFPTYYVTSSVLGKGGCSGAWVDDGGAVDSVVDIGNGGTFISPIDGWLQLGVNDVQFNDNIGAGFLFAITVNGTPPSVAFSSPAFTEIAPEVFFAGNPDPASLMQTINNNLRLALVRQEYFGPATYSDGDTIPLPVSDIDGHTYSRDELFYISDWNSTGPEAGGTIDIRFWQFDQHVDAAGIVHCHEARVPTGGGNLSRNEGTLRVLVIGVRNTPQTAIYDPTYDPRPPVIDADAGSFSSSSPKSAIKQLAAESTIIRNDAFDVTWSSGKVTSYIARSFPISDPGMTPVVKYVTIFDPDRLGDASGTLTSYIDDTPDRALSSPDYVFVGKIIATQEGGNTGSVVGPDGITQILATTGSSGIAVANPFGNNTSASDDYKWDSSDALIQSNFQTSALSDKSANPSPRNTSTRDVHELGASAATKWICHAMPWFGPSRPHISVGYNSDTDAQASAQVAFLKACGFDIVQAYINPRDSFTYSAAQRLLAACVTQGMLFNLCYPGSSFKSGGSSQVISDFADFNTDFFGSAAYHKWGGRPVVFMFDSTGANWTTVRAGISGLSHGNPALIFRNKGGRTVTESQGCYAWNDPSSYDSSSDPGAISYLTDFYSNVNAAGAVAAGEFVCGSMYVGFKGVLTAGKDTNGGTGTGWSLLKFIARQFNKTWRQCAAAANAVFDASTSAKTLPFMLVDTLNDYEEGTAVETGIPSGITIAASIANNVLTWSTVGDEGGVHQYVISRAPGGLTAPLTTITTVAVGATKSADLSALVAGNYNIFVIAEGIPLVHNESATVAFTR